MLGDCELEMRVMLTLVGSFSIGRTSDKPSFAVGPGKPQTPESRLCLTLLEISELVKPRALLLEIKISTSTKTRKF